MYSMAETAQTTEEATAVQREEPFRMDADAMRELALGESTRVPYVPKSKNPDMLGTRIHRNIAFDMQKALNEVVRLHGNIDNYVRDHLKYRTIDKLWKALAAEQIDSVALYLYQFGREQGIIIGDKTGVGKGRQAAAVLRHAKLNGYLPVMLTKKTGLYSSIYRDLEDIDFADIRPFIINTTADARVRDKDGNVVFEPLSSEAQFQLLARKRTVPTESQESIDWHKKLNRSLPDPEQVPTVEITDVIDYLPEGYDSIFCTYSQFQAAHPYKRLWLTQVVATGVEGGKKHKKCVFVLDESHTAGGYDSIIGKWMRAVLPLTKATCYLSATPTKHEEVIPLYKLKTAMQDSGLSDPQYIRAMMRGGLPLQEINTSNLAETGQFVRRERTMEGIPVEYKTLDEEPLSSMNRQRIDQLTRQMIRIVEFEKSYVEPILDIIHADIKAAGERMEIGHGQLGVTRAPYFSKVFNIIDQALFALKVEDVAREALRLLHEDKKVVIAFKSTMGVHLQDLNLVNGDMVLPSQLDFSRTLLKGLDAMFEYNYVDIEGNKSRKRVDVNELPPEGLKAYKEIRESIMAASTGLSISPLDQLLHILENAPKPDHLGGHNGEYFKVAEVTGRMQRVRFDNDDAIIESFRSNAEQAFRLFNKGDYDVLLLNQAGSTGYSAHSSKTYADQRQRWMIKHQFDLDINTVIQMMGRIDRIGQVVLPGYLILSLDIPQEIRLMSMLKSKLKRLDANTTGSQSSSDELLDSVDFLNRYGDEVAWQWVTDNMRLAARLSMPTYYRTYEHGRMVYKRNSEMTGAMRQVTGRAGLLTVTEQEALFEELIQRYEALIYWEKQRGTYNLETEFLPLDAEVKKRTLHTRGKGTRSPFGRDTIREECIVNNLNKPLTRKEVDELVVAYLDGKNPERAQKELLKKVEDEYPPMVAELETEAMSLIDKLKKELEGLSGPATDTPEEERAKIEKQREQLEELIQQKYREWNTEQRGLEHMQKQIIRAFGRWKAGDIVKVPIPGYPIVNWGIFIGAYIGPSKSTYSPTNISLRFAVSDSRKLVEYNLSPDQHASIAMIYSESEEITEEEKKSIPFEWNELIKEDSQNRVRRFILTGNIVSASWVLGMSNRLVKYNTIDGEIRNGILLDKHYGSESGDLAATVPISNIYSELLVIGPDEMRSDHEQRVKFKRLTDTTFQVFIPKRGNKELFTDEVLRSLIMRAQGQSPEELPDFVQNAGDMTAPIHEDKLLDFLKRLDTFNLYYQTAAQEVEDWEKENEQDWEERTREGEYRYKLGRPYGQGSNPTSGFRAYEEPSAGYPHGVVVFTRRLSDKERFNFSLIPLFRSVEEPAIAWMDYISKSALKEDYEKLLEKARQQPIHEAFVEIGWFMRNNAHEDGNPEFVFGEYGVETLGRAVYERAFGQIRRIDEIIAQLTIALEE